MAKKVKTRAELQQEFKAELYLQASFFKMKRVTSGDDYTPLNLLDYQINNVLPGIKPLANPSIVTKWIPEKEKMPKFPKGRAVRIGYGRRELSIIENSGIYYIEHISGAYYKNYFTSAAQAHDIREKLEECKIDENKLNQDFVPTRESTTNYV